MVSRVRRGCVSSQLYFPRVSENIGATILFFIFRETLNLILHLEGNRYFFFANNFILF